MMKIITEIGVTKPETVKAVGMEIVPETSAEEVEGLVETKVDLKPVEDFKTKDALEEYGKTLGIDLNKSKTIANMYADLVEFVK